jgi:ferric enterobactin receptor
MKKFTKLGLFCFFALFAQFLRAQDNELSAVPLEELLTGSLNSIFEQVGPRTGYRFEYDREKLGKLRIVYRPNDLKNLLDHICKEYQLKYMVGASKVVRIIGKNERFDASKEITQRNTAIEPTSFKFTLSGVVRDAQNGESLPFAALNIPGTTIGTSSNVDGWFSLLEVPSDTSTIFVSYLGYAPKKVFLTPSSSKTNLIIEMHPAGTDLGEVTVVAEREELLRTNTQTVSMLKMSPAKIATLPNAGERDIMRAFQLMPGVSAANENSSGLFVRGGTPDQNLNIFDGFTVYHVDHLFGFFSAFNPNAIKDVQLYKGGFPAKFGGRLSSVAEITGKDGNSRRASGGFDIGMLSANAYFERPFGEKVTLLVAGRRSWRSPLYNTLFDRFAGESEPALPGGGGGNLASFSSTVASYFYDLNGKLTFKPNNKDIYTISFYNGTDDMDNSTTLSLPNFGGGGGFGGGSGFGINDLTTWGNTGGSLKWSRRWNDRLYSNTMLGTSSYFSKRDRTAGGSFTDDNGEERNIRNGTLENNDLQDLTFRSDFEYKLSKNNQLDFGLQVTHNNIAYTYAQNDTVTILNRDESGLISALYVQDKLSLLNDRLVIQPGMRVTHFDVTNKLYFEPRASLTYQVTQRVKVKAATGQFYQMANRIVREDILRGSRDFWILSDGENVPVSASQHFIGGISYETKDYLFDIEVYHKNLDNLTEYSLRYDVQPGRGVSYDENFFNGSGYAQGVEFLVQKKYGKYNGWVSYTLGRVRYNFANYGPDDFPANQDVTNEFKMVHTYKLGKFDFSATWIYATGRPYTAPEGAYQLTLLDGTQQDYINIGAKNGRRLPDYHRFDAAATYHFNPRSDGREVGSLGLSLFNIYNRANTWYKEYEIVDDQLIENSVLFLGFTPNLSLSIKF